MKKRIQSIIETFWKFIRGDFPIRDFEQWLYSETDLESLIGEPIYFDIVSADYSSKDDVYKVKEMLMEYVQKYFPPKCLCITLSDDTVIDMGEKSLIFFQSVKTVKKRGGPYWWLSVDKCSICDQWWLVAAEERQNDLYCLRKLIDKTVEEVLNKNIWPTDFDKYETLCCIGYEAGKKVSFVDPMDSSLSLTITDLAKERPGITIREIAKLLNLDRGLAIKLGKKVVAEKGVEIDFN